MAHFRGTVSGQRGEASRLGSKNSGLTVEAQSWEGKVRVELYRLETAGSHGQDWCDVTLAPHHGSGKHVTLYSGPVSGVTLGQFAVRSDLTDDPPIRAAQFAYESREVKDARLLA